MHEAPPPHPSLAYWTTNTQLQLLTSSESLGWNGVHLMLERQEAMPDTVYVPYLEDDVFAFLLDGTARVHMKLTDGATIDTLAGPQSLQLIPRHSEFAGHWDSAWTYVVLRFDRQFITELALGVQRGDPTHIELIPSFYFNDLLLYSLSIELFNEMQSANPLGSLYSDSLTTALALYLLRHYSNSHGVNKPSSNRLTRTQLRMVDEYIDAHLEQKISLADLATCLHLSVPHFERMFRVTTQRPPYRYVLDFRLEQAKTLLETTHIPLAEVARQCGFSSQSHFTSHFTRYVGVSPARFARGARD